MSQASPGEDSIAPWIVPNALSVRDVLLLKVMLEYKQVSSPVSGRAPSMAPPSVQRLRSYMSTGSSGENLAV